MVTDYYQWCKDHVSFLYEKIQILQNDGLLTSPGDVWSIKKMLFLDLYIGAFVNIIKSPKSKFNSWYYVDTHCGTGLIDLKDELKGEIFPGSPMIAALRSQQYRFTDYLLSDNDDKSINALTTRLKNNKNFVGNIQYSPQQLDFNQAVEIVVNKKGFGTAFLFFIDPMGYKEIKWESMKKILNIQTADIIFTFMTYTIERNRPIADTNEKTAQTFDEFFGDQSWKNYKTGDELLSLYRHKLESTGKHTFVIEVFKKGENKLYDIIFVSRSSGATNVVEDIRQLLDYVDTELIKGVFEVVSKKRTAITDFM